MSMNNHVRSYIYQHNLGFAKPSSNASDSIGIPQKRGPAHDSSVIGPTKLSPSRDEESSLSENKTFKFNTGISVPAPDHRFGSFGRTSPQQSQQVPISSRFPFNQCTDFTLRDTKKSIDTSLRQFTHNKSSIAFMGSLRSCLRESNYTPSTMPNISQANTKISPQSAHMQKEASNSNEQEKESVPGSEVSSILIPPTIESEPRQMLLSNLNVCFNNYLTSEAAIEKTDVLFQETVNFITNLFIQEFSASGTRELCLEILSTKESGKLECILSRLIEEAYEKHIEQGFDDFQDFLSEYVISGEHGSSPRTEDPQFYRAFKKIWGLNPSEFAHYDLETLVTFCSSGKERPFTSVSLFHKLLNDMEEAAMKMNLVRFYYAFKRDLPFKARSNPIRDLNLLENMLRDAAKISMQQIKEQGRSQKPRNYKKERVRFHEGHVEVYV